MRFRRRRKPRVVWLPNPGTITSANDALGARSWGGLEFAQDTTVTGIDDGASILEFPLVQDVTEDPSHSLLSTWKTLPLNRSEEKGWRLRRIVGELWGCGFSNNTFDAQAPLAQVPPPAFLWTVGIIVRRTDADGLPVARSVPANLLNDSVENNSDPWVWRRSWVLTNVQSQNSFLVYPDKLTQGLAALSPTSTWEYGSGNVGGKMDQKTARRLEAEERLFFNSTLRPLPISFDDQQPLGWGVYCNFAYRILGTPFASSGNKRNAVR